MSLVTDVHWYCPGCKNKQIAQVHGAFSDPAFFEAEAVPVDRGFKWAPPCEVCGKFRLIMPQVMVECIPVPVSNES